MDQEILFDVSGEGLYKHKVGDEYCHQGWCNGGRDYPTPCKCGGLIHADFNDEDYDGNYTLYCKCDNCGMDYEFK